MTLPPEKLGDKGQRYEVTAERDGKRSTVGWSESYPFNLVDAIYLDPSADKPRVTDRFALDVVEAAEKLFDVAGSGPILEQEEAWRHLRVCIGKFRQ